MPPKDLSANVADWFKPDGYYSDSLSDSALFSARLLSDEQLDSIKNDLMSTRATISVADDAIQQSKIIELENLITEQKQTIYELSDKASALKAYTTQLQAELDELKSEVKFLKRTLSLTL